MSRSRGVGVDTLERTGHSPLPFLTGDLAGVGGAIKQSPDDFIVEEIPAYEPIGHGEHLYLWIEKRDLSAEQLVRHVARTLGIPAADVGAAGMKDRRAVTRQYLSVPARCEGDVPKIDTAGVRVIHHRRHANKLRTGHLRGNRFSIVVRGVEAGAATRADGIAQAIQARGFPNYFGSQRFGREGETLRLGMELLSGGVARQRSRKGWLLRLSLSAVQAHLLNFVVAERIDERLIDRVLAGDVMQVVETGGLFLVEDPVVEQARFNAGEIAVTGPMFGPKMKQPAGEPAVREARALAAAGLRVEDFTRFRKLTSGTRRALLARPRELSIASGPESLRVEFALPSGAYATSLLRELTKVDAATGEEPDPSR